MEFDVLNGVCWVLHVVSVSEVENIVLVTLPVITGGICTTDCSI